MSRKATNKRVEGVIMFWLSLEQSDKIEAMRRMFEYMLPATVKQEPKPKRPPIQRMEINDAKSTTAT